MLTGCAKSVEIDAKPVTELSSPQAQPPQSLLTPCSDTAELPARDLSAGDVKNAWAKDRVSLVECGDRKDALLQFYASRDRALAGQK